MKNKNFIKINNLCKLRSLSLVLQILKQILDKILGLLDEQATCQTIRIKISSIYKTKILKLKQALTHPIINLLSMSSQVIINFKKIKINLS